MAKQIEITQLPKEIQQVLDNAIFDNEREADRAFRDVRIPAIITTEQHLINNDLDKIITSWVNFESVEWSFPLRGAVQKVAAGAVNYRWKSHYRNTYYDTFPVGVNFQSGNILTPGTFGTDTPVPPGLKDFHLFLELLDEPPLMPDGRENFLVIVHTSAAFPSVVLKGWATPEGTSVTENVTEGFQIKWKSTLDVQVSMPRMNNATELARMFSSAWYTAGESG